MPHFVCVCGVAGAGLFTSTVKSYVYVSRVLARALLCGVAARVGGVAWGRCMAAGVPRLEHYHAKGAVWWLASFAIHGGSSGDSAWCIVACYAALGGR